jgi:hypothetical protein
MVKVGDHVWVKCGKVEHHATIENIDCKVNRNATVKWNSNKRVESGIDISRLSLMFQDTDEPRKRRRATHQWTPRDDVCQTTSKKSVMLNAPCVKIKQKAAPKRAGPVKKNFNTVTKKRTRALKQECIGVHSEASQDPYVESFFVDPHQDEIPIYTMDDLPRQTQVLVKDGLSFNHTYKATVIDHLDGNQLRIHWDMADYNSDIELWQVRSKVEDLLAEDWTQGPRRSGRRNFGSIDRFIPCKDESNKMPQEPKEEERCIPFTTNHEKHNENQKVRKRIVRQEKNVPATFSFEYPPAWQRHLSTRGNIWIVDAIAPTSADDVTDVGARDALWKSRGREGIQEWWGKVC